MIPTVFGSETRAAKVTVVYRGRGRGIKKGIVLCAARIR